MQMSPFLYTYNRSAENSYYGEKWSLNSWVTEPLHNCQILRLGIQDGPQRILCSHVNYPHNFIKINGKMSLHKKENNLRKHRCRIKISKRERPHSCESFLTEGSKSNIKIKVLRNL